MNIIKNKKFIATTLTFVLVMALAGLPLPAKERRGSTVEVTMTDGRSVKGELLAVKADTLLVYDRDADQGKIINLKQVLQVRVLRKSKFDWGLLIGLGVGLVKGANIEKNVHIESYWAKNLVGFGLIGGIIGAIASESREISLAGASSQIVQKNLKRLKRYAREKDV